MAVDPPTRTFIALVPESERSYVSSARDRFNWLSRTFEHLMDIEDEIRASHVLGLLEGWGNYLGPTAPEYLDLAKRHAEKFVKFSLNLRQVAEIRKARCTETTLLSGVVGRPLDLCTGIRETESERLLNDSILADVLRKDLRAAYQKLDASPVPRQLKMEMLLMSSTLQFLHRSPCVKLWDENQDYLPEQKFEILKAYWRLLFAWPSRDISESQLLADPLLAGIRTKLPHGQGIAERILLAIGNGSTEARLAAYPGLLATVRKCQARRHNRLYPLGHPLIDRPYLLNRPAILDRPALVDPLLDRPLLDPLLDRPNLLERPLLGLELESRVPTPRMLLEDRLTGSRFEAANHLVARRLEALRSPVPLAAGVFPGDAL